MIHEQTRRSAAPYAEEEHDSRGESRCLLKIIKGFENMLRTQSKKKIER